MSSFIKIDNAIISATDNGSVQVVGQTFTNSDSSDKIATCAFIQPRFSRLDTSMNSVISSISSTNQKFATIDASFSAVNSSLSTVDSLNTKFATIDASFSAVNSSLSTVNTLNTKFATIDASFSAVNSSIGSLGSAVGGLSSTVGAFSSAISSLNSNVSSLGFTVNSNTTAINNINTHLAQLDISVNSANSTDLTSVNTHLANIDASLNTINDHLSIIDASMSALSSGSGGGSGGSGSAGIAVDDVVQQIESSNALDLPSYGNNWVEVYPATPQIPDLKNIFCSGNGKYVIMGQASGTTPRISTDFGATWSALSFSGTGLIDAAISEDGKYMLVVDSNHNVALSTNYGTSWATNITYGEFSRTLIGYKVAISSTGRYQVTLDRNYAHYSSDYGVTWADSPYFGAGEDNLGLAMSHDGQRVYVLRKNQLHISTNAGVTWASPVAITQQNGTNGWMPTNYWYEDIACSGNGKVIMFIPARVGNGYSMVVSRDYGATFSVISSKYTSNNVDVSGVYFGQVVVSACGRYMTAGTRRDTGGYLRDGVYFSDDHGASWTQTSYAIGATVKSGQVASIASNNTGSIVYVSGAIGQGGNYGVFVSKSAGLAGVLSTCIPTNVVPGTIYFEDWTGLVKIWTSAAGGKWLTISTTG